MNGVNRTTQRSIARAGMVALWLGGFISMHGQIELSMDKSTLQWGERATLCATWTTDVGALGLDSIWWPAWQDTTSGGLEILQDMPPDTLPAPLDEHGDILLQKCWVVTSWDSGFVVVPPLVVDDLTSNALMVEVVTPSLPDDASPAPPMDIVAFEKTLWDRLRVVMPWLLALSGLVLLGWLVQKLRRTKRGVARDDVPPTPPRLPHEIALEILTTLLREQGWLKGRAKDVHVEAGLAVRHYLEGRFGMPAAEKTTGEVRAMMQGSDVPTAWQTRLIDIMETADQVKFAKAELPALTHESLLKAYISFVESTTSETP
ncbi:MAG: hypothetical protein RLZZ314_1494 [Bacteroidota bacterium]|jgi:hypothetical protein|nr:hypothetical protein [Bacteroidota bacterium]